jgi:protein-S-isoprenylcysteine O-methyltransferase Ste14
VQLLALFWLWTPTGVVFWRAEGLAFWAMCAAFAGAWGLLGLAILSAGMGLQSGFIGWWALLRGRRPVYPDMPTRGMFRIVRQPIYIAFALTLWTPPVWTADQVGLALVWTVYCLGAPLLKERRFAALYGARWAAYRARVPYWVPNPALFFRKDGTGNG